MGSMYHESSAPSDTVCGKSILDNAYILERAEKEHSSLRKDDLAYKRRSKRQLRCSKAAAVHPRGLSVHRMVQTSWEEAKKLMPSPAVGNYDVSAEGTD